MKPLVTFILLLSTIVASADESAFRVSGIFSNLRHGKESGDLTGWEILVVPREGGGYNAIIQLAEGGAPLVVKGTLVVNGTKIVLAVPAGQPLAGKYNGTISATELRLETPAGPEKLKRGKSYWQ